jgi:hypothetical protein
MSQRWGGWCQQNNTLDTIKRRAARPGGGLRYKLPLGEAIIMVNHGALSKSHVYHLLRSKDARVRRFTLLEASNPQLRRSSELFVEITRFKHGNSRGVRHNGSEVSA